MRSWKTGYSSTLDFWQYSVYFTYTRKYLESLDWVDGTLVGIIGGSYGGYMVAEALAFEPEAFKESRYDEMGDPEIIKPMLVVQGANDLRVLQVESDELVAGVQSNEVTVEYLVFPDEGHGFRKRENHITASDAYVKFLDIYLKGER